MAGHDVTAIIGQITADSMDRARSVSGVLHGRLQSLRLPDPGAGVTWAQRIPDNAPQMARDLASALDQRCRELGERQFDKPEPWALRHLGPPAAATSPALSEDWKQRAGVAAAYREARGITRPYEAVSFSRHPELELEMMRKDTIRALQIPDEDAEIHAASRGQLEAWQLDGERIEATAPPEVASRLRLTAQAETDAWAQSADAQAAHQDAEAANASALAATLAAERGRLEQANARYEDWSAKTADSRETAGRANAELRRRGLPEHPAENQRTPEPQRMTEWWADFQADAEAADRAIGREHQAAIGAGQPWPPQRQPAPDARPEPEDLVPGQPEVLEPRPEREEPEPFSRVDEDIERAHQATRRIQAQRTELDASAEYVARIERETEAAAEPQAEMPEQAEIEL
jgi:hypothetical protein